ncbi:MAG: GyrI-like domain-containing protein [Bacteroidia bacterium]
MNPKLINLEEKKLVGLKLGMSFEQYQVAGLWRTFMPRRNEIVHSISEDMISMAVYPKAFFDKFNPSVSFVKWAAIEVKDLDTIPDGMESFVIPAGLYAVFHYRGLNTDHSVYDYIFGTWIPASEFQVDDRPHFEVLGAKYKNNDPNSEEEIWIPVRPKN